MTLGILVEANRWESPKTYRLNHKLTRIGRSRSANCDILLDDESISRIHATIESRGDDFVLVDADSRNGTYVNEVGIVRRVLRDGDRIKLGDAEFIFQEIEDTGTATFAKQPDPETDENSNAQDAQTITISFNELRSYSDAKNIETINSWQIMKLFAKNSIENLENTMRAVVDDIAGARDISWCRILIGDWSVVGHQLDIRSQSDWPEHKLLISDERLQNVAENGVTESGPETYDPEMAVTNNIRAIAFPITIRQEPVGFLFVQSENMLQAEILRAIQAAAEAVGVGIAIWDSGRVTARSATMERSESMGIIGKSRSLHEAVKIAEKAARAMSTVLLRGETGTGKELFAKLIHQESPRKFEKFIAVNCSVFQDQLLDDALFGHEKGAFTGAVGMKKGYFEALNHGTIFLDEIGELSPEVQAKLLRVLQEGEIIRVGGIQPIKVDVRVIAATHRDLEELIKKGQFREDLYYRLNVIEITLPPLRERREDIPELLRYYIADFRNELSTSIRRISDEAMDALSRYSWPGNIRELRNVIERAMVLAEGEVLELGDIPLKFDSADQEIPTPKSIAIKDDKDATLAEKELQFILETLDRCKGHKTLAAKKLGISRTTLNQKLKGDAH